MLVTARDLALWANSASEPFVVDGHPILVDFDDPTLGGTAGPVFVSINTVSGLETNVGLFKGLHLKMGNSNAGGLDLGR